MRVACWASSTVDDWVVQLAAWLAAWRAETSVERLVGKWEVKTAEQWAAL
jgi:hypothetical protein